MDNLPLEVVQSILTQVSTGAFGWAGARGLSMLKTKVANRQRGDIKKALEEESAKLIRARTLYRERQIEAGMATTDGEGNFIPLPKPNSNDSVESPADQPQQVIAEVAADGVLRDLDKAINRTQTTAQAAAELLDLPDEDISRNSVDPAWATRWDDWVGNVSDSDLQRYWARILAGEVKRPGSFSLHTLDLLSRMARQDAELIDRASRLRINNFLFRGPENNKEMLELFGLTYMDRMILGNLGIIDSVDLIGSISTWSLKKGVKMIWESHNKGVEVNCFGENWDVKVPVYPLTRVGKELCSLGEYEANGEYLQEFAKVLKHSNVVVMIGDLQRLPVAPNMGFLIDPVEV